MFGNDEILECPNCFHKLIRICDFSTMFNSGYSDGFELPFGGEEVPKISKCPNCNSYHWLDKLEIIYSYPWDDRLFVRYHELNEVYIAELLNLDEYFHTIESGVTKEIDEFRFVRLRIWWEYNNRIRDKKNQDLLFDGNNDYLRWKENCECLLHLLDESNKEDKYYIAELYRNLGDFKNCVRILLSITKEPVRLYYTSKFRFYWYKSLYEACCNEKRWLLKICY